MVKTTGSHVSKSDLLACISHDMRTPLSAILGFAQLMESSTPSPTASQQERIDLILQAGWYLDKLIDMTNDLALLESGNSSLSLQDVSLAAVMLDLRESIESKARIRGVRVKLPSFETPCVVSADQFRLQQVFSNLLSAAIEYSEMEGVIVVECEAQSSEWVHIGIHDGGEGFHLQPAAVSGEVATIGLLLAMRLVEMMGGVIGPQSTVGRGKIFSFDLRRISISDTSDNNSVTRLLI